MAACDRQKSVALRTGLVSSVAVALLVGLAGPGGAAAKKPNPEIDGFGEATNGVLQIVVSIGSQRVTLFNNGVQVAQGPVSTGTRDHPTPMGVFSIIEKDRWHESNIYDDAPMYFMQRITWSGIAMHEGVRPGAPASHGCIRLSHDFAARLWPTTKLGVRVIVARPEVAPVDFDHPKLFAPKPKPVDLPAAMNEPKPSGLVRVAESTEASEDAGGLGMTPSAPETPKPARLEVEPPKRAAPKVKLADQPVKRAGQVAVFVSRKEQKIFVRQGFAPLFEMPVVIEESDRPLGTHVFTAMGPQADGSGMRWSLITIPTEPRTVEKERSQKNSKEPTKPAVVETKPASSAADALDRIQFPKEAVDRIGELLISGSSLIVSDEGNSSETGRGTDFIVLTP